MSLRKSTRIDSSTRQRVHTWTEGDFHAEVRREHDGWWVVVTPRTEGNVTDYRGAVDIVMDDYRLAKAGINSWEEAAAEMAERPWEDLSDAEQQDLINAARFMARTV